MTDKIKPATRADVEKAQDYIVNDAKTGLLMAARYTPSLIATMESWKPVMDEVASIDIADSGCLFCMDDGVNHVEGCPVPNAIKLMEDWNA